MTSGTYHFPRPLYQRGVMAAGSDQASQESGGSLSISSLIVSLDKNDTLNLFLDQNPCLGPLLVILHLVDLHF